MYCPKCFNNTLLLLNRGVIELTINGKQMDAGRFLFNLEANKKEAIHEDLQIKLEEFFKWYSGFKNKDPIQVIELSTADFKCSSCQYAPELRKRYSIIDVLIPRSLVLQYLKQFSQKYQLELKLKNIV